MGAKSFTRYYRDPTFKASVDEQFAIADAATEKGVWITYAIHDPTRTDYIGGEQDGLIIYVGLSKEFGKRVRKRMRTAGTAMRRPTDRIDGACYDIMVKGPAPRFKVRERTASAIDGLISETNTAKRLLKAGYPLLNQWTEQAIGGLDMDRYRVPHDWLWPMTVSDAIGSDIGLIVRDPEEGTEMEADLAVFPQTMRIRDIKAALKERGKRTRLYVR